MVEEFHEADVLWPMPNTTAAAAESNATRRKELAAVDIPKKTRSTSRRWSSDVENDGGDDGRGEMIPPHLLTARRAADKVAYSLCSGSGRTLKGRDLSHVRNAVLRMTGFIER